MNKGISLKAKKGLLIIFLVCFMFFFIKSPNPIGLYVAKRNLNTCDTIELHRNGTYSRVIYLRKNNIKLFENKSNWKYVKGRLIFDDYFPNDDLGLFQGYDFNNVLLTFSVPLEKSFGRVVFDYEEVSGKYRFYKLYF